MKLHWGQKIIITFIFFFMIMGTLIYKSINTDFQLVAPNYYEQEIAYQDKIEAINRGKTLGLSISQMQNTIAISATDIQFKDGVINFYRPSNKALDFQLSMQLNSEGLQTINTQKMKKGKWKVELSFIIDELLYVVNDVVVL